MASEVRVAGSAFKARWEEAQKIGIDRVEDETVRRALDGTQKAVFYAGRQIASVPQFNDRLLQFLLKAHKPETYDRPRAAASAPTGYYERIPTGRVDPTLGIVRSLLS